MSSMLVVGSVAYDTIHNHLGTHERVLGGSATFAALAACNYVPVKVVGVVGEDFSDASVKVLRDKGIDLRGLEVVPGKTFFWEGRYSPDLTSRESLQTQLNVFADFHPKIPAEHRSTPYVLLGNIHPDLQVEVLDQIDKPKLVVADTMNFWISGEPEALERMLARIDLLVINEEEARQLSGVHNLSKAAKALREMGPRTVVIKQGEYGALLFGPNGDVFSAPAFPVDDVKDPTGAGDSFAGGMLGYLAQVDRIDDEALRKAVIHGSVVASILVEGVSVERLVEATPEQIQRRYAAFARLSHFATQAELDATN